MRFQQAVGYLLPTKLILPSLHQCAGMLKKHLKQGNIHFGNATLFTFFKKIGITYYLSGEMRLSSNQLSFIITCGDEIPLVKLTKYVI